MTSPKTEALPCSSGSAAGSDHRRPGFARQIEPTGIGNRYRCIGLVARRSRIRSVLAVGLCGAALSAVLLPAGCAGPLRPVFEPIGDAIAWPPPPKAPRIRYVGSLSTSADLKPQRKLLAAIADLFVGRTAPQALYGPRALVCTRDGKRVWIADPGGRCLHMFDLEERIHRKIQRLGETPLLSPVGLCIGPAESIYVCDSERVAIYRLSGRDGKLIESLRLPEDVIRPVAMNYDETADELFVVDVTAHNIKVLGMDGRLRRILGRRGTAPGEFNFPSAIAADENGIWIADTGNHRVQAITRSGDPIVTFGRAGDAPGDLALPKGIALDPDGHVYVVDGRFENVQIFDREGNLMLFFGEEGTGPGEFWLPGGLFIEPTGRIWVCDSYNRRVQVFEYIRELQNVR